MLLATDLFLIFCLSAIVFQDFKHRQISWLLIPLLFAGFVCKTILTGASVTIPFWNIAFILIQLALLTVYMSIKNKKLVSIINTYLGLGDVLFFVVTCFAFSPVNYIVFYLLSTLLTLFGFLFYNITTKKANNEIPLAGAMAAGLIILIIANRIVPQINFYNDGYLLKIIDSI